MKTFVTVRGWQMPHVRDAPGHCPCPGEALVPAVLASSLALPLAVCGWGGCSPQEGTVEELEIWLQLEHAPAPRGRPFPALPLALKPLPTLISFGVLAVTSMISQLGLS